MLTVIAEPHRNVLNGLSPPPTVKTSLAPKNNSTTCGPSPASNTSGANTTVLSRFVYHESNRVLPPTTLRLCLITTECIAVIAELATPNPTPTRDNGVPSRKTPMKKPSVTMEQEMRMRREGRACNTMKEVQTVKGRTRPRATW
jgi:hypothetical protein